MSDTPRTDAVIAPLLEERGGQALVYQLLLEHARQLERELDKREKQLIEVQQQLITRNAQLAEATRCKHPHRYGVSNLDGSYEERCGTCNERLENPFNNPYTSFVPYVRPPRIE